MNTLSKKSAHILRHQVRTSRGMVSAGSTKEKRDIAERILRASLEELARRGLTP